MNKPCIIHHRSSILTIVFLCVIVSVFGILPFLSFCEKTTAFGVPTINTFTPAIPRLATSPDSSDPTGDEWPMFRGALNHTGVAITTPQQGTGPLWSYTTGADIWSSPAITGGRLYVGSNDNTMYCLNASTGAVIWSTLTSDWIHSSPAVAGDRVYFGNDNNNIYCLNATNGTRIWNYTTISGSVGSSPAIAGGRVYVGSYGLEMYCLNATTGTNLWQLTTAGDTDGSPAVASGRVYVGSGDRKMYCLNATTGNTLWTYTAGGFLSFNAPAVADGRVYVGSNDGNLYCINATSGTYLWSYYTSDFTSVESSPAVQNDRVYFGCTNFKYYCLNAVTGSLYWNYTTGGFVQSSAALSGGRIYIGSVDHNMYCLDATTGAFIWSYGTAGGIVSSPAIANGRVYFGSMDHKIYCLPMIMPPSAPQNLQANNNTGLIQLSWQAPRGNGGLPISSYKIHRGNSSGQLTYLASVNDTTTTYTDSNTTRGSIYYYTVRAVNGAGEGVQSNEASATITSTTTPPIPGYHIGIVIGILAFGVAAMLFSIRRRISHF